MPTTTRVRPCFAATLCFIAAAAFAAPPAGFDARVEKVRNAAGIPGMSIAIVEDGEITLARGYGVRKLGSRKKVDPDTIFPTGSTGKAFTVTALAILADRGEIAWDDPVIDHMPWFRMYDPWVTREITVRDLLVHRSGLGLGAGDLLFVPRTNLNRRESVERLRHIKPATSFRSAYAYDNVLYMVAGQLIEEVTGRTWETFVAEEIFDPAGMSNSTSDDDQRFENSNRAAPHGRLNGKFRGLGDQEVLDERDVLGRNSAPAGGLSISANDMARWLMIQLDRGALPDGNGRLFSESASNEMWTPVVFMPVSGYMDRIEGLRPHFNTYALGWDVMDYHGALVIRHDGAVFGFLATVVLIPEENVGFSFFVNSEDGEAQVGLMYELLDHYLGRAHAGWPERIAAYKKSRVAEAIEAFESETKQAARVGPSLALQNYAGSYTDPWYGPVSITLEDGNLVLDFLQTPDMTGVLEHWQYDTFRTNWTDKTIEPAYVTFVLDADGKVERITMKAVSPLADFSYDYHDLSFTPTPKDD
jgi:CubicO group peptidase (beta-lactamase class C family)